MLVIRRVGKTGSDYDSYLDDLGMNIYFHLREGSFVNVKGAIMKVNIFSDLNLKVSSSEYGANISGINRNAKMEHLAKLIERKFGSVEWGEEGGLHISLQIELEDDSKAIYFISGGNKGQELCVGMYVQSMNQLQDDELGETIKYIDDWLYEAISASGLHRLY